MNIVIEGGDDINNSLINKNGVDKVAMLVARVSFVFTLTRVSRRRGVYRGRVVCENTYAAKIGEDLVSVNVIPKYIALFISFSVF